MSEAVEAPSPMSSTLSATTGRSLVGHDREDAGHGLGRARVDGEDAGVRVGAAQDRALDEVGEVDVGAVERLARDLLDAVGADGTGADDLVVGLLGGCHAVTSSISDALRTGANDLVVAGAAAEVAGQPVADAAFVGIRLAIEQGLGGDDEARRADAALQGRLFEEALAAADAGSRRRQRPRW